MSGIWILRNSEAACRGLGGDNFIFKNNERTEGSAEGSNDSQGKTDCYAIKIWTREYEN